jgi:uncharacterized protein YkwD
MRRHRFTLTLIVLLGLLVAGRALAQPGVLADEPRAYLPLLLIKSPPPTPAQQVVDLVNQERAKAGCQPLIVSAQLTAAAQGHSQDMATNDFFSHTGSNGSSPWQRIQATGYQYSAAAENIAYGYSTAAAVMQGWMSSSGHRKNILNCGLREIGVGYATHPNTSNIAYWTQDFATPR